MEIRVFCYLKKKSLENCSIAAYDSHLICYEMKFTCRTYFSLITSFEENFTVRKSSKLSGRLTTFEKTGDVSIETSSSLFNELPWYMYNGSVIYQ